MNKEPKGRRGPERGIALLIAIFVLLLISVVAIALLVSSGTETALGTNYRASSTVYYAALAGLEEARGRLLPKNPNYFGASIVSPSTQFPLGRTLYVINRLSGDSIVPWDPSNPYYDKEYGSEFNPVSAATATHDSPVYSVWDNSNSPSIPGPSYKWVRITAATEQSLYLDVDSDGLYDDSIPIYYNPAQTDSHGNPAPSLIKTLSPPSTAVQVLQITALAYLPNGSQKVLQYLVAPVTLNLTFPGALTLDGLSDAFTGPSSSYQVSGNSDNSDGACGGMPYPVNAIHVPDHSDAVNIRSELLGEGTGGNYTGNGSSPPSPSVGVGGLPVSLQTAQSLNQIAQTITQNADTVLTGNFDQNSLSPAMSNVNPMTVAVLGDFTLSGGFTGYGLLLVTGTFTYDAYSSWDGVILVVGKGIVNGQYSGSGPAPNSVINGAMLVAQTLNPDGTPRSTLGPATFNSNNQVQGTGIYYRCNWIQAVQAPWTYKVLSFHEIPQ
jgi:hypothetical protein